MKKLLSAAMLTALLLSACSVNPVKPETPSPVPTREAPTPPPTVPASAEPTETPMVGQPVDMDIVPESYAEYLLESDFEFLYDTELKPYAAIPDISSVAEAIPNNITIGFDATRISYTVADIPTAVAEFSDVLLSAGFEPIGEVSAELDFYTPPEPGDVVFARGSDVKWVSLQEANGELEIRYALSTSYGSGDDYLWLDRTGDDGSGYTGPTFDGSYIRNILMNYYEVPSPNAPMSTPLYKTNIELESGRITINCGSTYLPEVRAESCRMTYEDAGFTTESFSTERSVYVKDNIRVTILLEIDSSGWLFGIAILEMT